MSTFKEYLTDNVRYEEITSYIKEDAELDVLAEALTEMEVQLDEFLGLGKLASKLSDRAKNKAKDARKDSKEELDKAFAKNKEDRTKIKEKEEKRKGFADKVNSLSAKADEKVAAAKTAIADKKKEVVDAVTAKKEAIKTDLKGKGYAAERAVADAKKSIGDKKEAVKDSFLKVSSGATTLFKKLFKNLGELSEDQKKTVSDLEGIYEKLSAGKAVGGLEAIKILATILAGSGETGEVPSYKAYSKQLAKIRELPGFNGYKFAVKAN